MSGPLRSLALVGTRPLGRMSVCSRTPYVGGITRLLSTTAPRALSTTVPRRYAEENEYAHLQTELPQRRLPVTFDHLIPTQTHLLDLALADFLPDAPSPTRPTTPHPRSLPPAYHLIYFPPAIRGRDLLPDGTDPLQSPGEPFVRRMWAGGAVKFNNTLPLPLDGSPAAVLEAIRDVTIKGQPGDEKVFVGIERRVGSIASDDLSEDAVRRQLWREDADDFGDSVSVIERRNIVFMRERSPEKAKKDLEKALNKQMAPPDVDKSALAFNHAFTPNEKLLFRYSALTYNAHAIHLDPEYARETEGHRNLLLHGPLSFTCLVTLLRRTLDAENRGEAIASIEYRNLAPLYAHEQVTFKGRRVLEDALDKWEVWAETPQGGVAVRGIARTEMT